MTKGFTYRFIIYSVVVAYVLVDLKVIHGPLHDWVMVKQGLNHSELIEKGVVATVYGQPILESQVHYRLNSHLYKRGRQINKLSDKERALFFDYCLEQLIQEHLFRIKVHHNELEMDPVEHQEIDNLVTNLSLQFSDRFEYEDALKRQGYSTEEISLRAQAHIQQTNYLGRQITVKPQLEDLESFSEKRSVFPPKVKLKHLFLSTWEKDSAAVKAKLSRQTMDLPKNTSRDFTTLSNLLNEDAKAKKDSGLLGWVSNDRLPKGLEHHLFDSEAIKPAVVQSALGWHYIEVIDTKPAYSTPVSAQETEAYIESQKRLEGLDLYLRHLREREKDNVVILKNATQYK